MFEISTELFDISEIVRPSGQDFNQNFWEFDQNIRDFNMNDGEFDRNNSDF